MSHPDPTAEQIAAELADHLAASASALARNGIPTADAEVQAREKFGDVSAVSRQCYWVQQGDTIMFRRVTIALVVLLCVGLIATTANSWLAQSRMTQQLAQLNEQLASLTKTQESLQDQQKPLSITGLIYDGDKSKPVANHEVGIARLSDCEVVRKVITNAQGELESAPLPAGDYFVFSRLKKSEGIQPPLSVVGIRYAQGPPVYLYPGLGAVAADLDVGYQPTGQISLECSPPMKSIDADKGYRIIPSLKVTVRSSRWRGAPWEPAGQRPNAWPIFLTGIRASDRRVATADNVKIDELFTAAELDRDLRGTLFRDSNCLLPEGHFSIQGVVVAEIVERDSRMVGSAPPMVEPLEPTLARFVEVKRRMGTDLAEDWIGTLPDFNPLTYRNVIPFQAGSPSTWGSLHKFSISNVEIVRLRVKVPPDWDRNLRSVLDTANGVNDLIERLRGGQLFCPVEFERIGSG